MVQIFLYMDISLVLIKLYHDCNYKNYKSFKLFRTRCLQDTFANIVLYHYTCHVSVYNNYISRRNQLWYCQVIRILRILCLSFKCIMNLAAFDRRICGTNFMYVSYTTLKNNILNNNRIFLSCTTNIKKVLHHTQL